MPLRPALKTQPDQSITDGSSPLPFASTRLFDHVHFPPTPTLATVALTHSPNAYDRAPIRVAANTCTLPERGARTYFATDGNELLPPSPKENLFQPHRSTSVHSMQAWSDAGSSGVAFMSYDRYQLPSPSMLSECSSESDTSDIIYGSPTPSSTSMHPTSPNRLSVRLSSGSSLSAAISDGTYQSVDMQTPEPAGFTLLPCPGPKPKILKSGMKKKKSLQADIIRRWQSLHSSSNDDPALEGDGCLGGF